MRSRRLAGSVRRGSLLVATLLVAPACRDSSAPEHGGPVVITTTVEPSRSSSARIGADGGQVTAVRSDGARFTLAIPEGALLDSQTIALTPIAAVAGLPLSGGLMGAVKFEPDGLHLAAPATLTIDLPAGATLDARMKTVAFAFEGAGADFHLVPSRLGADGRSVELTVAHFSGAGVGQGSVQDLQRIPSPPPTSAEARANQDIVMLEQTRTLTAQDVYAVLHTWYQVSIRTALQGASTDVATLDALSEYGSWKTQMTADPLFAPMQAGLLSLMQADLTEADGLAAGLLRQGVQRANQACVQQTSLVGASNVMFWTALAARYALATPSNQLDAATILDNLCVRVSLSAPFPASVPPVTPTPLVVSGGLSFNGGASNTTAAAVRVTVTASGGASASPTTGVLDPQGRFTSDVTPPSTVGTRFSLKSRVCLEDARYPLLRNLCTETTASSQVITAGGPGRRGGACGITVNTLSYDPYQHAWRGSFGPLGLEYLTQAQVDSVGEVLFNLDLTGLESSVTAVALNCLTKVGNNLTLGTRANLTSLRLPVLATVTGYVDIRDNPQLTQLQLPMTSAGRVVFYNNGISSMSGFAASLRIAEFFDFRSNANLCDSEVRAYAATAVIAEQISIQGNGAARTNCPP